MRAREKGEKGNFFLFLPLRKQKWYNEEKGDKHSGYENNAEGGNAMSRNQEGKEFGRAVLGVSIFGSLLILLILLLVLLNRNGTLPRWKKAIQAKIEAIQEKRKPKSGDPPIEITYIGPQESAGLSLWELLSWFPEQEAVTKREPLRDLPNSPVNGSEDWWEQAVMLKNRVPVYAAGICYLYGKPDNHGTVYGQSSPGEKFTLVAVLPDGWYVIYDGDFYYCADGREFLLSVPSLPKKEEIVALLHNRGNTDNTGSNPNGENNDNTIRYRVTCIRQKPELAYGCEVTSLAMLLNYYGVPADKCNLAAEWLPKGEWGKTDFREAFVGNPSQTDKSAGCYASVVEETANRYLRFADSEDNRRAVARENLSWEELFVQLQNGPMIVWTTMQLRPSYIAHVWETDERELLWQNGEHCVVLTGYDLERGVFFGSDPLYGECEYNMDLFLLRFETMFSQAVWMTKQPTEE